MQKKHNDRINNKQITSVFCAARIDSNELTYRWNYRWNNRKAYFLS